jgi:RNA polymerase sigma factor (sigma-70 family)
MGNFPIAELIYLLPLFLHSPDIFPKKTVTFSFPRLITNWLIMPAPPYPSDDEIVRLLRSDEGKSVEKGIGFLCSKYRLLVEGIVRRLGGDLSQDVGSVLDDTALAVREQVRNGHWNEVRSKLKTWFYSIAWHTEQNILRKRPHREMPVGGTGQLDSLLTNQYVDLMEQDDDFQKRVAAAILKLGKPCQEILWQHLIEDKPLKEIGEQKGLSYDAVKKKHSRCKQQLRELLRDEFNW